MFQIKRDTVIHGSSGIIEGSLDLIPKADSYIRPNYRLIRPIFPRRTIETLAISNSRCCGLDLLHAKDSCATIRGIQHRTITHL